MLYYENVWIICHLPSTTTNRTRILCHNQRMMTVTNYKISHSWLCLLRYKITLVTVTNTLRFNELVKSSIAFQSTNFSAKMVVGTYAVAFNSFGFGGICRTVVDASLNWSICQCFNRCVGMQINLMDIFCWAGDTSLFWAARGEADRRHALLWFTWTYQTWS